MKVEKITKSNRGFSLVELMVVVAIIGVLAALAIPRFKTFQAKARQSEAKTNLAHLFTLEQSYHGDNDTYIALGEGEECSANLLGFQFDNCSGTTTSKNKRYYYSVTDVSSEKFLGHAQSSAGGENKIIPGCSTDHWTVDQTKLIWGRRDVVSSCTGAEKDPPGSGAAAGP